MNIYTLIQNSVFWILLPLFSECTDKAEIIETKEYIS